MGLSEDLERVAGAASRFVNDGEELVAVIPAEPAAGVRVYLCAFAGPARTWLAFDEEERPVEDRALVRDAVSIAAMCEIAEETAGGGNLEALHAHLAGLRATENPEGIGEAEEAAAALEQVVGTPLRVASPEHLDRVGTATRRLELALGEGPGSPFAELMKGALGSIEELKLEVEASYKAKLQ